MDSSNPGDFLPSLSYAIVGVSVIALVCLFARLFIANKPRPVTPVKLTSPVRIAVKTALILAAFYSVLLLLSEEHADFICTTAKIIVTALYHIINFLTSDVLIATFMAMRIPVRMLFHRSVVDKTATETSKQRLQRLAITIAISITSIASFNACLTSCLTFTSFLWLIPVLIGLSYQLTNACITSTHTLTTVILVTLYMSCMFAMYFHKRKINQDQNVASNTGMKLFYFVLCLILSPLIVSQWIFPDEFDTLIAPLVQHLFLPVASILMNWIVRPSIYCVLAVLAMDLFAVTLSIIYSFVKFLLMEVGRLLQLLLVDN